MPLERQAMATGASHLSFEAPNCTWMAGLPLQAWSIALAFESQNEKACSYIVRSDDGFDNFLSADRVAVGNSWAKPR